MARLPESVLQMWEQHVGPMVLATVGKDGVPNAIYTTCVGILDEETIVVANNYFNKTMKNISAGSRAALLFITPEKKSYQIKGRVEYHESGPIFVHMKSWNPPEHPGHGAAALKVEEVYSGAERIV
ncbi:MAG: pyridoxamine 5'-phosphate oxidase family protein [bacterium]